MVALFLTSKILPKTIIFLTCLENGYSLPREELKVRRSAPHFNLAKKLWRTRSVRHSFLVFYDDRDTLDKSLSISKN